MYPKSDCVAQLANMWSSTLNQITFSNWTECSHVPHIRLYGAVLGKHMVMYAKAPFAMWPIKAKQIPRAGSCAL